jgi:hypothetical protein
MIWKQTDSPLSLNPKHTVFPVIIHAMLHAISIPEGPKTQLAETIEYYLKHTGKKNGQDDKKRK